MFIDIMIAIIIGILIGIVTGLTPGVHVNLVSVICVTLSPWLLQYTDAISLGVFIISLCITHVFLDSIPSIYLGAPEAETALGVLPGHRFLLKGEGMKAVKLTIAGSIFALLLSVVLFIPLIPVVKYGYPIIEGYIGEIIIFVVVFMMMRERKKLWGITIFLLSGALGMIVFNIPNFKEPMFAMFSGMFGIATLLYSFNENENIPEQNTEEEISVDDKVTIKALFGGQISGFITAVMPGLGASTAAVIGMQICRGLKDAGFLIMLSSINCVNFVLSLLTLLVFEKARNGAIISIQKIVTVITPEVILIFIIASLITGGIGTFLTLKFARMFAKMMGYVSYKKIIIGIIVFITALVVLISGWIGIILLIASTAIGMIPAIVKTSRTHAMGCLLLPVICYFML